MANPHHLQWLTEGVESWNARRERDDFIPDLAGYNFSPGAQIYGQSKRIVVFEGKQWTIPYITIPLTGFDFSHAFLVGSNFANCDLNHADFKGADLHGCSFLDCRLANSNFSQANLTKVDFSGATLFQANLSGAVFSSTKMNATSLVDANVATYSVGDLPIYTDIRGMTYLRKHQLNQMHGDEYTVIHSRFDRPLDWLPIQPRRGQDFMSNPELTPSHATASFAKISAPFDLTWTKDGELHIDLIPVTPRARTPLPDTSIGAQMTQLAAVGGLAKQIRRSVTAEQDDGNFDKYIGDVADVFAAIEGEVHKPEGQVLITIIRANLRVLESLAQGSDALSNVNQELLAQFLLEANRLLTLYPILNEIDDPRHESIIPDDDDIIADVLSKSEDFLNCLNSAAVVQLIGPRTPQATQILFDYRYSTDRQKAATLTILISRIRDALENRPAWVDGAASYVTILTPLIALAVAVIKLAI